MRREWIRFLWWYLIFSQKSRFIFHTSVLYSLDELDIKVTCATALSFSHWHADNSLSVHHLTKVSTQRYFSLQRAWIQEEKQVSILYPIDAERKGSNGCLKEVYQANSEAKRELARGGKIEQWNCWKQAEARRQIIYGYHIDKLIG